MEHPQLVRPQDVAQWRPDRMGKATIFQSPRLLVGLNAFEPGQEHALHGHDATAQVGGGEERRKRGPDEHAHHVAG